jgi:hypothetical protein
MARARWLTWRARRQTIWHRVWCQVHWRCWSAALGFFFAWRHAIWRCNAVAWRQWIRRRAPKLKKMTGQSVLCTRHEKGLGSWCHSHHAWTCSVENGWHGPRTDAVLLVSKCDGNPNPFRWWDVVYFFFQMQCAKIISSK